MIELIVRLTDIVVAKYVSLSFPLRTPPILYTVGLSGFSKDPCLTSR